MHVRVRQLYKEFMMLAQHIPTMTSDRYRNVVRRNFLRNAEVVPESPEFKKALAWGRVGLREVHAIIHIHKFRFMKKSYDWENSSNSFCGGLNTEEQALIRRKMEGDMMKVRAAHLVAESTDDNERR